MFIDLEIQFTDKNFGTKIRTHFQKLFFMKFQH